MLNDNQGMDQEQSEADFWQARSMHHLTKLCDAEGKLVIWQFIAAGGFALAALSWAIVLYGKCL